MFREENQVAQRNSERARRKRTDERPYTIPFETISPPATQEQQTQASTKTSDSDLQWQYLWLNERALAEIPGPLKRDPETRAVDRFFVSWILYPHNDGVSPGHLHDLPMLYLSAPRESVLWYAVRAVAFADMRGARVENIPFYIKARQQYGAALLHLREIAHSEQRLANDRVLAAILLIDSFEVT